MDDYLVLGFKDVDAAERIRGVVDRGGDDFADLGVQIVDWSGAGRPRVEIVGPRTYDVSGLRSGVVVAGAGGFGRRSRGIAAKYGADPTEDVLRWMDELKLAHPQQGRLNDLRSGSRVALVMRVPALGREILTRQLRTLLVEAAADKPDSWSAVALPRAPEHVSGEIQLAVDSINATSFQLSSDKRLTITLQGMPTGGADRDAEPIPVKWLFGDLATDDPPSGAVSPSSPAASGATATQGSKRDRFVEGRAPDLLRVDESAWLLLQVSRKKPKRGSAPAVRLPASGARVHAVLSTSPHLEVTSAPVIEITVPAERDSGWHGWEVQAVRAGSHDAVACVYHCGELAAALRFTVTADAVGDGRMLPVDLQPLDLQPIQSHQGLLIVTRESNEEFSFVGLDADHESGAIAVVDRKVATGVDLGLKRSIIDGIMQGGESAASDDRAKVLAIGQDLHRKLLPDSVAKFLRDGQRTWQSLKIMTNDHEVPWELLADDTPDNPFLANRLPVLRWRSDVELPARGLSMQTPTLIEGAPLGTAGQDVIQSGSQMEIETVSQLIGAPKARRITRADQLVRALRSRTSGLVHYSGHMGDDHGFAAMRLQNAWFSSANVSNDPRYSKGPLVFLNGCSSDRQTAPVAGLGSWSERFIRKGAGAFIGTNWIVRADVAHRFASSFYGALAGDQRLDLARATQKARRDTTTTFASDWFALAYAVYGHPEAALESPHVPT